MGTPIAETAAHIIVETIAALGLCALLPTIIWHMIAAWMAVFEPKEH